VPALDQQRQVPQTTPQGPHAGHPVSPTIQVPAETQAHLARLRAASPVRRVGSRAQNVSGTYASRKMGCTLQFESHKVELWAIYTMEYDPTVLEYYDQPTTLTLRYPSMLLT